MNHEPEMQKEEKKDVCTGKKLRIGMIGAGNIARLHVNCYNSRVPNAEIVAFCDIDEDRLPGMQQLIPNAHAYTSMEEMIAKEELDAADVCVWNVNHAKCAIYAMEHGLDVMCEKPMAFNAQEAIEMKRVADKTGKLLMIGFVMRFQRETQQILDFKEDLGKIYYAKACYLRRHGAPFGWFCDKARSGGGPVIDLGVHVIDQTRYLMGCPKPVSVFASTSYNIGFRPELKSGVGWTPMPSKFDNGVTDVEDFGTALIRFDNDAVMLLETSYSLNGESSGIKALYGDKGGVVFGNDNPKFYTVMHDRLVDVTPASEGREETNHFHREMMHFVDCCLNKTPCIAPAEDGIWVMKILDAIYESARTKHEVIIK